ncbi:MAG: hypothetical protein PVJ92_01715 [Candidatus Dependentiae bacterium]|jgi:hypothetical protein
MTIFSRWSKSFKEAVRHRTRLSADIWTYAWGAVPMVIAWFSAFLFFEYCTPSLAVQFPQYSKLLWGVYGLVIMFIYVTQVLRNGDAKRRDNSHYLKSIVGYALVNTAFVMGMGIVSTALIIFSGYTLHNMLLWLLAAGALLGGIMGFFLPVWTYNNISVLAGLKESVGFFWCEWPALLVTAFPYLLLAFVGQWVPHLVTVGYLLVPYPLAVKYVPLLAQGLWLVIGTAAFIAVYKRRKNSGRGAAQGLSFGDIPIQIVNPDDLKNSNDDNDDDFKGEL